MYFSLFMYYLGILEGESALEQSKALGIWKRWGKLCGIQDQGNYATVKEPLFFK